MPPCTDKVAEDDAWFVWPSLTSEDCEMCCEVWVSGRMVLDGLARASAGSQAAAVRVELRDAEGCVQSSWGLNQACAEAWEALATEIYTATKGP
jgi:hypothetical protein